MMDARSPALTRNCCDDACRATVASTTFDDQAVALSARSFEALGDDTRLKMVKLLSQHDALCVCELQQAFDLGQPTISHHLRVLRDAGLVDVSRRGVWAYYSLRRTAVKTAIQELVSSI